MDPSLALLSVVESLSCVRSFATPWTRAWQLPCPPLLFFKTQVWDFSPGMAPLTTGLSQHLDPVIKAVITPTYVHCLSTQQTAVCLVTSGTPASAS